jgi:hypothetical protein
VCGGEVQKSTQGEVGKKGGDRSMLVDSTRTPILLLGGLRVGPGLQAGRATTVSGQNTYGTGMAADRYR